MQAVGTGTPLYRPLALVVDDDPSVLEALGRELRRSLEPFFLVETAASAEEAIEILDAPPVTELRPVAIVVSDEKMPGRSGTEMLVELRRRPEHRHGGRILITGYAGLESAKRAINEAEVESYVSKPWDEGDLLWNSVSDVASRFLRSSGLDAAFVASVDADLLAVREIRKAWLAYIHLVEDASTLESMGVETSCEGDESATHLIVRRTSPRETLPVACARLSRDPQHSRTLCLEHLFFAPEHAGDEVETLIARLAIETGRAQGVEEISTVVPGAKAPLYELLGFRVIEDLGTRRSLSADLERVGSEAHRSKLTLEHRLCACSQSACHFLDYAKPRRSYPCALDLVEGRGPAGLRCSAESAP